MSNLSVRPALAAALALAACLAPAQTAYVTDGTAQAVETFDVDSGAFLGEFGEGILRDPFGIAASADTVFVTDATGVFAFDAATGALSNTFGTGLLASPGSLALMGSELYALDGAGSVFDFDAATGSLLNTFGEGRLQNPTGLALRGDSVFVGDAGGILEFDRNDGSYLKTFGAGEIGSVAGLAFGLDGTLYVSDSDLGAILAYNPATGLQTDAFGFGFLQGPRGLAVGPDGLLSVADGDQQCVFRFDPDGGFDGLYGDGISPSPINVAIAPVPEPATLAALAVGLASLARRRRKTMTTTQIGIVKATVPVLQLHGEAITRAFYKTLFEEHPALKGVFDMARQKSGEQPRALAAAILAYAGNVDRLDNLGPAVAKIAHRHCRLDVAPEHYPIVGDVLLRSIKAVLGDAASPGILDAWAAAYARLAEVMIEAEREIYTSACATC